jgi:hypothetical protein
MPQHIIYMAMHDVFPFVIAYLNTMVCGVKYADCDGCIKELLQISTVSTIFHTDVFIVV